MVLSSSHCDSLLSFSLIVIQLKNLLYTERLKELDLHTLKYRRIRGNMIEIFKIIH